MSNWKINDSLKIEEKPEKKQIKESKDYKIKVFDTVKNGIAQRKTMEDNLIPRHPSSVIINSSSGGGKTNLLCNLMCNPDFYGESTELDESPHQKMTNNSYKSMTVKKKNFYFDKIYLFSPTAGKFCDLCKHLIASGNLEEKNIFNEFDEDTLKKIIDDQKEAIEKDDFANSPRICLIYDDIQSNASFMRCELFKFTFIANRHINMTTILLSQSFKLTPRSCRLQANNVFIFPATQSEVKILLDEFLPAGLTSKEFMEIIQYATGDKHSFLHINRREPPLTRFRKNLDEILKLKKQCFSTSFD